MTEVGTARLFRTCTTSPTVHCRHTSASQFETSPLGGGREGRREGGKKEGVGGENEDVEDCDGEVYRVLPLFFLLSILSFPLVPSLGPYLLSSASAGGSALRKVFRTYSSRTGLS
jgi:hypothetical protein